MTAVWIVIGVLVLGGAVTQIYDDTIGEKHRERERERDCLEYLHSPEAYLDKYPLGPEDYPNRKPGETAQQLYGESMDRICEKYKDKQGKQ